MNRITEDMITAFHEAYRADAHAHTLHAAMAKTPVEDLAFVPMQAAKLNGAFELEIKTHGITALERSGRCWLYAVMNILREAVIDKCGLEEFELSGNYLAFFDKLEKANNILEMAIRYADLPWDDRMTEYVYHGYWDGGYWDMAADLVAKYGAVPKDAMPETWQSSHTERFVRLMNTAVRKGCVELQKMVREGKDPQPRKKEILNEIFRAQCIAFGEPVTSFDFTYRDKDGNYHSDLKLTPKAFYEKYIGIDLHDYVTVTHHPTEHLPMDLRYKFHYIGSMAEGDVDNLNLTMDELQELCLKQLRAGMPVWFGCDSGAYGDRKMGIWDPDSLDFEGVVGGMDLWMDKKTRLESRDSFATHAMILIGVHFDENGEPLRWKIENSWGKDVGKDGYFVCSQKYFREYVYEAIIHKDFLNDRQKKLMEQEAVEVPAWASDWM